MSTRGLLGFSFDGKLKGCYNHYDSYPRGLGVDVVEFIQELTNDELKLFNENIRKIEWVNRRDISTNEQLERLKSMKFYSFYAIIKSEDETWNRIFHNWMGSEYLFAIFSGFPFLPDDTKFINDSLYCEYAYIINLDNNTIEFYEGFQYIYGHIFTRSGSYMTDGEGRRYAYGPCKKVGELAFSNLNDWMNKIVYKTENYD